METSKLGLSRKTNIAIAGVGSIALAKDAPYAIIAILVIVLAGQIYQFVLDKKEN